MTTNRHFGLDLEALAKLKADVGSPPLRGASIPAAPTLSSVLSQIGSLPREALFLGIATDGLPMLLNLHDSLPGPLFITGAAGSGKTSFLQMIAHSVQQTHRAEDVQFGVITSRLEEWGNIPATNHRLGLFSVHDHSAQEFLHSLSSWAHANKSGQSILLLIDDLEAITKMEADVLQNFRWLLLRGPSHRAWPVVTLDAERYSEVLGWIPMFRTRIFGRVEQRQISEALGADQAAALERLEAGLQFTLRENGSWLRFWLPTSSNA